MKRALMAVAGSGKTESIVQEFKDKPDATLFVTYTTNGQKELESRLRAANPSGEFEVLGWYGFLANHFLKPFMYDFNPDRRYDGLVFDYRPSKYAKGDLRYFTADGRVSSQSIGYVARKIAENDGGEPIRRLERIFDRIVFDEVQDLVASDLVILEMLLKSKLEIYMVGDIRQTVFETNTSDRKYSQYRKLDKIGWFEEMEAQGLLELHYDLVNRRCHKDVVSISNAVFRSSLGFDNATGEDRETQHSHSGVFRISEADVQAYCKAHSPQGLGYSKTTAKEWSNILPMSNFGDVKGLAFDHVVIFPTKGIKEFLLDGKEIGSDETAAKLYVAITRARHSVCFVLPNNKEFSATLPVPLKRWSAAEAES